jgi:hypothetical protein
MEVRHLAGVRVKELQSEHVQQSHFDSVEEETRIGCPIADCSKTRYPIPHMLALGQHIKRVSSLLPIRH